MKQYGHKEKPILIEKFVIESTRLVGIEPRNGILTPVYEYSKCDSGTKFGSLHEGNTSLLLRDSNDMGSRMVTYNSDTREITDTITRKMKCDNLEFAILRIAREDTTK